MVLLEIRLNEAGNYMFKVNNRNSGIRCEICSKLTIKKQQFTDSVKSVLIQKDNPLSANPTKWSNTLKQFVDTLAANRLSVFDHFVILALEGLRHL